MDLSPKVDGMEVEARTAKKPRKKPKPGYFIHVSKTHLPIKRASACVSCRFGNGNELGVLLRHHSDHSFHQVPLDAVMSLVWSAIIIQRWSAGNREMEGWRQKEGRVRGKAAGGLFRTTCLSRIQFKWLLPPISPLVSIY